MTEKEEIKNWLTEKVKQPVDHHDYEEIIKEANWSAWEEVQKDIEPGDEVWHFRSSQAAFEQLCGREGYALLRDGEIVDALYFLMS